MITATRNWLRRNRYPVAIGAGLLGAGYLAGQYVLNKFTEPRQRMSDDRIAKENLRRRFTQNQEDCTYTVLGLLPTVTENIMRQLPVEEITNELQVRRSEKLAKGDPSASSSEIAPSDVHEEGSAHGTGSFVHASQTEGLRDAASENPFRSAKSKLQLWENLKIQSITRAITLVYTIALLSLLTRIQLNLLGQRSYLSSVVSLASPPPAGSSQISLEDHDDNQDADYSQDFDTNRKYLTFSWWLLHRGWRQIMDEVDTAVREVFSTVNPRDAISFEHLGKLVLDVRKRVEGATADDRRSKDWLKFSLPSQDDEELVLRESGVVSESQGQDDLAITPSLRRLLDQTSDMVESPTFSHVLTLNLDSAFSLLVDEKIATLAFKISSQHEPPPKANQISAPDFISENPLISSESRIQELPEDTISVPSISATKCKLATILAIFTRQAHVIGSGGDLSELMASAPASGVPGLSGLPPTATELPSIRNANEYLAAIEDVKELEAFAAVIYSSNFELEPVEADEPTAPRKTAGSSLEEAWSKATAAAEG